MREKKEEKEIKIKLEEREKISSKCKERKRESLNVQWNKLESN